jgi:hypothetical protein
LGTVVAIASSLALGTGDGAKTVLEVAGELVLLADDGAAHLAEDGLELE